MHYLIFEMLTVFRWLKANLDSRKSGLEFLTALAHYKIPIDFRGLSWRMSVWKAFDWIDFDDDVIFRNSRLSFPESRCTWSISFNIQKSDSSITINLCYFHHHFQHKHGDTSMMMAVDKKMPKKVKKRRKVQTDDGVSEIGGRDCSNYPVSCGTMIFNVHDNHTENFQFYDP